jgi:hypothetical protein
MAGRRMLGLLLGTGASLGFLGSCGSPTTITDTSTAAATTPDTPPLPTSFREASFPEDFRFNTARVVKTHITVLDDSGAPLPGVGIILLDDKGNAIARAMTDAAGDHSNSYVVPADVTTLDVRISAIGRISQATVPVGDDDTATWVFN